MSVAKEAKQQDRPLELGAFLRELVKVVPISKAQFDDLTDRRRTTAQQRANILSGAQKVADFATTMIEVLRVAPGSK